MRLDVPWDERRQEKKDTNEDKKLGREEEKIETASQVLERGN